MSNCVHDNGGYCEVFSDKEVRQPCFETPLCKYYKEIVRCKDCKFWGKRNLKDILKDVDDDLRICNYWRRTLEKSVACVRANDFCSKGKKKDGLV